MGSGQVAKFLNLPRPHKRLLTKTLLFVWIVRMALWTFPFRVVQRLMRRLEASLAAPSGQCEYSIALIVWAVSVASRYVPSATCLTQAMVTRFLLGCSGHESIVRIGVARTDTGKFQFHAWVESNGNVVIGDTPSMLKEFTPLFAWDR